MRKTITQYYKFSLVLAAMIMVAVGCNQEEAVAPEVTDDGQSQLKQMIDKGDLWVDQAYLDEMGMTVEELLAEIDVEQDGNVIEGVSTESTNPFTQAYIAEILTDMVINSKNWFAAEVNAPALTAKVGVSTSKLDYALRRLPGLEEKSYSGKKNRNRNILNLDSFSLGSVRRYGSNGFRVDINGNAKFRYYRKVFGKYRKLLQVRGTGRMQFDLKFDTVSRKVIIDKPILERISLKGLGSLLNVYIGLFTVLKGKVANLPQLKREIYFPFMTQPYLTFTGTSYVYKCSANHMMFHFRVLNAPGVSSLLGLLNSARIPICR